MQRVFLSCIALALLVSSLVQAQTLSAVDATISNLKTKQTGLLTTRLSDKNRIRWKAIEQLVFAQANAEPLHPVLCELWRWADASGHVIQVELIDSKSVHSNTAGSFNIERYDPTSRSLTTSLKLYLSNIDQAVISPHVARANGFVPFESLRKEERYAEVLGHELAHVKYVLSNTVRTRLVQEFVETTNDLLLLHARTKPAALTSPEMKQRLSQRDELLRELETQAETIEVVVWRELVSSQKARGILKSRR